MKIEKITIKEMYSHHFGGKKKMTRPKSNQRKTTPDMVRCPNEIKKNIKELIALLTLFYRENNMEEWILFFEKREAGSKLSKNLDVQAAHQGKSILDILEEKC